MHSRLEQYLQTVEQNLQSLPVEERHNELTEIRLHIESLVEANREFGSTEEEAVAQTLAQFGRAQKLGKGLTRAHQREGKPNFRTLAGAIAFNYLCGQLYGLLYSLIMLVVRELVDVPFHPTVGGRVLSYLQGLLITFGIGWLTGAVLPRYAVKGTLYANLLGTGVSLLYTLQFFSTRMLPASILPIYCTMQLIGIVLGTSCALLGAKLGARWRNKRDQKLRLARS